jgi:hypothetical protein
MKSRRLTESHSLGKLFGEPERITISYTRTPYLFALNTLVWVRSVPSGHMLLASKISVASREGDGHLTLKTNWSICWQ